MEFMKPETLEAIKKEVEMSPVEWLEKEVKKRFGGETFTSVFSVEFERSKKMENDIIEGATKYASLLESEREKSEKLRDSLEDCIHSLKYAAFNIDGRVIEDLPNGIVESTGVSTTALISARDAKNLLTEYKTTSK